MIFCAWQACHAAAEAAALHAEYSQALERIERLSLWISGTATGWADATAEAIGAQNPGKSRERVYTNYELKQSRHGRLYRFDRHAAPEPIPRVETVDLVNERYRARLTRHAGGGRFQMFEYEPASGLRLSDSAEENLRGSFRAACSLDGAPLVDIIQYRSFHLISIEDIVREGMPLKRISFTYRVRDRNKDGTPYDPAAGAKSEPIPVSLVVDPKRGWVLLESERRVGAKRDQPIRTEIAYSDRTIEGIPVPRVIRTTTPWANAEHTIETFEIRDVPPEEFSIAAYGLRDSTLPRRSPGIPAWGWVVLVLGVIGLVVLGVVVRRRCVVVSG